MLTLPSWWKPAAVAVALFGAFVGGRWSVPREAPVPLVIAPPRPLPERDLSPAAAPRTVLVPRTTPGRPCAPPAAVPADLGQHLQTTSLSLPAIPAGAVVHDALYGAISGDRLTLRDVAWADSPSGPVKLGQAETVTHSVSLQMPGLPRAPRWGIDALPYLQDGRIKTGVLAEAYRGPVTMGLGYVNGQTFGVVGARW